MLHAVPELLDALEVKLLNGEDPAPLLAGIRWSELVGWPEDMAGAKALKQRIAAIQAVVMGLQSPLRSTLMSLSASPVYGRKGMPVVAPAFEPRVREKV